MKNFPNQISRFERIRAGLALIAELDDAGQEPSVSEVLGYECARRGIYTFRGLGFDTATKAQIEAAIADMRTRDPEDQGPLTFARDLRRTLRVLGWIDAHAGTTRKGAELLATAPGSVAEQGVLVEGLLNIEVTEKDGSSPHHPTMTLLRLLDHRESYRRDGLELAFQPKDDSDAEFQKLLPMYAMARPDRIKAMNTTRSQRDNAVKILPSLCVAAGLVVESGDHYFSLSQEGWALLGRPPTARASTATKRQIARRGRRTTVGRLVTAKTIAKRRSAGPPRTLSAEEQQRASKKLLERTTAHQALVSRMAGHIGDGGGELFEDEFSYDMLWVPHQPKLPALLFEMKTITGAADAHARVRTAMGQLSYYEYFHVGPRLRQRAIQRVIVTDDRLPAELLGYLSHEKIAAIVFGGSDPTPTGLNPSGTKVLGLLPSRPGGPRRSRRTPGSARSPRSGARSSSR
jgi:hypothetical protein